MNQQLLVAVAFTALVSASCGFDGLSQTTANGGLVPDTQIAASAAHIVEVVNNRTLRMWSRAPFEVVATIDAHSLVNCPGTLFDPRIRYDHLSGRWFFVIAGTTDDAWCFAVSTSSDPTGSWVPYTFSPDPPREFFPNGGGNQVVFPDFPGLGIGEDKVIITGNLAHGLWGVAPVEHSAILVLHKADLLAGGPVRSQQIRAPLDTTQYFALQPVMDYAPFGEMGEVMYAAGVNHDSPGTNLRVYWISGLPGVGAGVSATPFIVETGQPFTQPADAEQLGTSAKIATNDKRVLDVAFRDGNVWVALHQGCTPPGDTERRSCLRFLEVGGGFLLTQDFTVKSIGDYYYYPAISLDLEGNLISVFNRSSNSEYASIYVTGRRATDSPNTARPITLLRAGQGTHAPAGGRRCGKQPCTLMLLVTWQAVEGRRRGSGVSHG